MRLCWYIFIFVGVFVSLVRFTCCVGVCICAILSVKVTIVKQIIYYSQYGGGPSNRNGRMAEAHRKQPHLLRPFFEINVWRYFKKYLLLLWLLIVNYVVFGIWSHFDNQWLSKWDQIPKTRFYFVGTLNLTYKSIRQYKYHQVRLFTSGLHYIHSVSVVMLPGGGLLLKLLN